MKTWKAAPRLCLLLFLTACASPGLQVPGLQKMSVEEVSAILAGKTVMTYTRDQMATIYQVGRLHLPTSGGTLGHGTQVEYFDPSGHASLWYPGNQRAVPSLWEVRLLAEGYHQICFLYPQDSYNPATRSSGGKWRCRAIALYFRSVTETREGDLFALSGGKLPFILARDETTFDELIAVWER